MMYSSVKAITSPLMPAAATCGTGTCQTATASTTATASDSGMARLAGQRSPTRKTATVAIGNRDRTASRDVSIRGYPFQQLRSDSASPAARAGAPAAPL